MGDRTLKGEETPGAMVKQKGGGFKPLRNRVYTIGEWGSPLVVCCDCDTLLGAKKDEIRGVFFSVLRVFHGVVCNRRMRVLPLSLTSSLH